MTTIRPAVTADLPVLGVLAGKLVRQHHAVDPMRFMLVPDVERGYQAWFARELANPDALLLVAEQDGAVIGYTYSRIEARDWNALLDRHGALHDILVDESARGRGVGKLLLEATLRELDRRGTPMIVLSTMTSNLAAQRLFASCGFRATMVEMTRDRAP